MGAQAVIDCRSTANSAGGRDNVIVAVAQRHER
jgi:hypothetical protein